MSPELAKEIKLEPLTKAETRATVEDAKRSAKKASVTVLYSALGMAVLAFSGVFTDPVHATTALGGFIHDPEKLSGAVLILTFVMRYVQDRLKARE